MPEVHYRTVIPLPRPQIWSFVENIDNWAPMMTGYISHEIKDERNSVWTLKGDVGILSRTVRIAVTITEWAGPGRVDFILKGLNEAVEGGGSFLLEEIPEATPGDAAASAPVAVVEGSWFQRLVRWFARMMFRAQHGQTEVPVQPAGAGSGASTALTFTWRMEAGGPTAPLVNAMLEPALEPAAEELARRIAAHLLARPVPTAPVAA